MKQVRSRDNPFFKELAKLSGSARQRGKVNQTLLDGAHLLSAYLGAGKQPQHILLNAAALHEAEIAALLERTAGVPVTQLDDRLFAGLSELKTPSGILALIGIPQPAGTIAGSRFALLLEDIQDPGNLGSMLRSAAAAGCDAVFLSTGCADAWSPKVLRAAMGGHFALDIHERQDLLDTANAFPGMLLAASLQASRSLYDCDLRGHVAFLVGNEGAGLSAGLLNAATQAIAIPMPGRAESLNAAAATAICLFEAVRQRIPSGQSAGLP
ncbi:MAG: rRNA methyltransferase [Gallionellales bacterium RIFCSPLOWO2_12_FULL_59_22]|nr:MAG: rRNA methyltransferase [Gallionellales bacterium RIFCSPLOWO2_02_FULL_59_110]OGT01915.1 MAG: rRNA methyltransferase [Gallionellales bacterium RIFCSPLOWO2_02_58_13]OGT13580.1 MAG: rRNA methyltransferase [Gallionellales bacterium RIFCSPLOWO2_12_FULL_59_22]